MFCTTIKRKMLFILLCITSISNAQEPLMQGVGEDNDDDFKQLQTFLKNDFASVAEECNGLEFSFNIWHKGTYDKEYWEAFAHNFLELVLAYDKKNPVLLCPTFLGEPLQTLLSVCDSSNGISYELKIDGNYKNKIIVTLSILRHSRDCDCDDEPCSCKKFISKKDHEIIYYNEVAWQKAVKAFILFTQKIKTNHPSKQVFIDMYPVLKDIIAAAEKESGLHGNFTIFVQRVSACDLTIEYGLQENDCEDADDFTFNEDYVFPDDEYTDSEKK